MTRLSFLLGCRYQKRPEQANSGAPPNTIGVGISGQFSKRISSLAMPLQLIAREDKNDATILQYVALSAILTFLSTAVLALHLS
jgi:hypothetical protein